MSDQEHRDQLQCSVRNEGQRQQRGDTEGNVMHRTQGRQGREDRRSCSRNEKCSGVSRQVTKLGPTQYTDLGSQLQTFPELITCVTPCVTPQQSFIQIPPEPEPGGNSCPLRPGHRRHFLSAILTLLCSLRCIPGSCPAP